VKHDTFLSRAIGEKHAEAEIFRFYPLFHCSDGRSRLGKREFPFADEFRRLTPAI
jgi:hypothetical protein